MASISGTGITLPSAASLFAAGQQQPQASDQPVNGPTVTGPGGTTALPSAAPADFASGNPTALDQPHPQYPSLIQSHVAVLQAIGTPEAVIAQLAQQQPQAEYLDRYIQGEIMQNPEGWDDYVGNPRGTARAGLARLLPGVQLPAPGGGNPGYLADGSTVSGINVPGLTTPLMEPTGQAASEGEGLIKGLVLTAAAVGVGLLAWKFVKNRKAAAEVAKTVAGAGTAAAASGGGAAGAAASAGGASGALRELGESLAQMMGQGGDDAMKQLTMQAFAKGGSPMAASVESIARGLGPANGHINSAGLSALAFDMPMTKALEAAKEFRYLDIMEMATKSNQLGDFALASAAAKTSLGFGSTAATAAAGGVANNAALKSALQAALNLL